MIENEKTVTKLFPHLQEEEADLPKQVIDLWVEISNSKNGAKEIRRWDLSHRDIQNIVDGKIPHPRIFEATIGLYEKEKPPTKRGRKIHLDYGRVDANFSGLVFCKGTTFFDMPRTKSIKDVTCSHCLKRIDSQLKKMDYASEEAEEIIGKQWKENKEKNKPIQSSS
tara:strand:- start:177 stop:677 length:501 start_codon:yes stop_codon:yes gene_type:complete